MTIHACSNETQTRWDKGGFQVMLKTPDAANPFGFCDGDLADEAELRSMAEMEGAEVVIEKKCLKTGREIWTIRTLSEG